MFTCGNCSKSVGSSTNAITFLFERTRHTKERECVEADAALCAECGRLAYKHLKRFFGKRIFRIECR